MKKNNPKIILTFFSILMGILIAIQMKIKVESYAPVTINALEITKKEIININTEIIELDKIIESKEKELAILDSIAKGDENIIDLLVEDIKNNKMNLGHMSLEGPGITISMYDNPEERPFDFNLNNDIIHDIDTVVCLTKMHKTNT